MTLTMVDGPVANLPPGMDAYGGYVDRGGIGITYPQIVSKFPNAKHFSFAVHGAPAMCADVEPGAMSSWIGYDYGYAMISQVQSLINRDGRPKKLCTAHYNYIPHICDSSCGFRFTGKADGTQWTDHPELLPNNYDEWLLEDDFFELTPPPPKELHNMNTTVVNGNLTIVGAAADNGNLLVFTLIGGKWQVIDVTDVVHAEVPNDPRSYKVL